MAVHFEGRKRLLDPDAIARELNPEEPTAAAIAAGRETLRRAAEYLDSALSFVIETTLSGRLHLDLIREAKSRGWEIHFVFICLDSPDRSIERIRTRAQLGGHRVPEKDVRRRYSRSLENCAVALPMADRAEVYDNSGDGHRLILAACQGAVTWRSTEMPVWAKRLSDSLR
jgi:predicted ABC-type ATPase